MVNRRSHDGKASDRCDGTDVRVDANMPRRRSAISAAAAVAATSSRPLSSDLRSSAAIMKLVRCRWCGVDGGWGDGRHSIDRLVPATAWPLPPVSADSQRLLFSPAAVMVPPTPPTATQPQLFIVIGRRAAHGSWQL